MSSSGSALVWLLPDDAAGPSPLADLLAADHRVVTLNASSPLSPGIGQFVLIGQTTSTPAALELARSAGEACTALVLMAPVLVPLPSPESAPDMPILLLIGTDDTRVPPSAADALCTALPRAHPILVYGAGHALDRERVEAVAAVINDFVARGDKFIVRDASDVLYP